MKDSSVVRLYLSGNGLTYNRESRLRASRLGLLLDSQDRYADRYAVPPRPRSESRGDSLGGGTMPERKVKVPLPTGIAEGFEVPVTESVERWTELRLEDGSVLRIKPVVVSVIRIEGQYDPQGNPMYAVQGGQTMVIGSVPDHLRRGGIKVPPKVQ